MESKKINDSFKLLSKDLQKVIRKRFKKPTKVQKLAIPTILSRKNALVIAPTGVGKTESCILPIFDLWLQKKPKPISMLYISPLKSLNRDLLRRFLWWGQELDMDISVRHGDTSQYARKMQAEVPPDCLITTPETLQAILPGKKMKEHLRNVKWCVIDEVHELCGSKRGTQLTIGLERLRELCGDFQLVALSATIGEPEKVANFISGKRPVKIVKAVTTKEMSIRVINPKSKKSDTKLAEQVFTGIPTAARLRTVHDLIKKHTSTLTFTNTRDFAEVLTSRLKQAYPDFPVENHHSSLSKGVRIDAEEKFKNQELKTIVCTSSLELGIDIGSIDFVLQYMSPRQVSRIIQRVGRSGHELGRVSEGVIISTDIDDIFESAVIAKQALSEELEPVKSHEKSLDVLAHQIVGMTRDNWKVNSNVVYDTIKKAYPYHDLRREEFLSVCRQLSGLRYIFLNEGNIKSSRKGLFYYFENLSTIPDTKSYWVINSITDERVGTLDEEFVALHGIEGTTFIIKGEPWRIITVDGRRILVESSGDIEAAIPGWEGDLMPVPYQVAQEVGRLREFISQRFEEGMNRQEIISEIKQRYSVDNNSAKKMVDIIKKQKKYGIIPTDKRILIENHGDTIIIHTCLGTQGNETLGRFLTSILTPRIGSINLKTDPYRVVLELQIINLNLIKEILFKTDVNLVEPFLEENLSNSKLFQWRFIHVAKRFGMIRKDADYGKVRMNKIIDLYEGTPVWKETLREIYVDKLDVEKTKDFLKKVQKREIEIIFKKGLSPLGKIGLKQRPELVGSGKPDIQILDIFEKRLLDKKVRLVCLNCVDWDRTYFVKDLPEEIRCGKCGAKLIGVVGPSSIEYKKIIKKKLKGIVLSKEEERKLERVVKTSDLVIVYGSKAVKALAARGVGPRTANRILRGMYLDERDFLKALLNAERIYIKNKKYWG